MCHPGKFGGFWGLSCWFFGGFFFGCTGGMWKFPGPGSTGATAVNTRSLTCCTTKKLPGKFQWLQIIDILVTLSISKRLELKRSIAELLIIDVLYRQDSHINLSALGTRGGNVASLCLFCQSVLMWLLIILPTQIGKRGYNNKKQRLIYFFSCPEPCAPFNLYKKVTFILHSHLDSAIITEQ